MNRRPIVKTTVGRVYIIAGLGEMLCVEGRALPELHTPSPHAEPPAALTFAAHGTRSVSYWAEPHEVVREAFKVDIERRHEQALPRGLACTDPDCWCREVAEGP